MTECNSEFTEIPDIIALVQNTMLRIANSADEILEVALIAKIAQKIQKIMDNDGLVQSIEYFLYSLIDQIQILQTTSPSSSSVVTHRNKNSAATKIQEDYQNLQQTVQKAQAQIRKHIRLEQQMKIYMDGLEEQIQDLQKQVKSQEQKYKELYENTKVVQNQKKELLKKVKAYEHKYKPNNERELKHFSHKASKLLTEPSTNDFSNYKVAYERNRNSRGKNLLQKSAEQQHTKNLKIFSRAGKTKPHIQNPINVSLGASPRNIRKRQKSCEPQQMTQTLLLKETYKKNSRKVLKYHTEHQRSSIGVKQLRSNSVCN